MYLNKRLLVIVLVIGLLAVVGVKWFRSAIPAHTPSTPHLTVGLIGDSQQLKNLYPDGSMVRARYLPQSAVYESPVRWDPIRGIRPLLLDDWRMASDACSVDLIFKKNIPFHNGKELTAFDVKLCWEKTLKRAASSEVVGLFAPVAGVDNYLRGSGTDIYGLQVISSHVLRVKFARPQSYFVSSLTHPAFWVYDSSDKTASPPGTGPFALIENKNNVIRVDAFANYHGDGPRISGIEFQIFANAEKAVQDFKAGNLNLVDEVEPAQVKGLSSDQQMAKQLIRQPLLAVYGVALNLDKEPWQDNYLLRRAVNYAIDRQAIVRDIFANGALVCTGPLPTGLKVGKASERGYSYNPELAKQLLNEAGHPDGDDLPGITLYYLPDSGHRQLADSIAEQLAALGVEVYPRSIKKNSMLSELNSRRFQSCLLGWQADYPEPYALFTTIYNNGVTGYQNIRVSKLLDEVGSQAKVTSKSKEAMLKAYKIITEDAPMIWLCQPQTVKLAAPLVGGLEINGLNQIEWCRVEFRSQ